MKAEHRARIQEIIAGMRCQKGFECAEGRFETLCKARDFGDEQSLQCLEGRPCPFASVYNTGFEIHFCRCPLRVYLAKNFAK
ncbi:MAG: hypothetical protein ABIF19_05100 [Planctomycetota bacterium]